MISRRSFFAGGVALATLLTTKVQTGSNILRLHSSDLRLMEPGGFGRTKALLDRAKGMSLVATLTQSDAAILEAMLHGKSHYLRVAGVDGMTILNAAL